MNTLDDLKEKRSEYREKYLKEGYEVPPHEIVMHPKDYADLMSDPDIMTYIDMSVPERNFCGIPIINDRNRGSVIVRDRTMTNG